MNFYRYNGWITEGVPSKFIRSYGGSYAESNVSTVDWRTSTSSGAGSEAGGSSSWRADHTFSSAAAGFSLRNFIEPEIESTNPHLSKHEIQSLALKKFEQRLKQDLSFEHKETSHHDSTVHWTVVEGKTGKKELATKYGDELITLSQLWEHTKEYAEHIGNPRAYNKEEARSQIAMQDAFINGHASGFVSILSHPDNVRYVQLWEKMPTGDIESKQIDLYATTGRDFTHKEGEAFINRLTQYHETIGTSLKYEDISYAHVLFTSGAVTVDEIKTIAVAHAFTSEPRVLPIRTDMASGIALKVAKDIQETVAFLGADFYAFVQKRVDDIKDSYTKKRKVQKEELTTLIPIVVHESHDSYPANQGTMVESSVSSPKEEEKLVEAVLSEWVFEQSVVSYGIMHEEFAISALQILSFQLKTSPSIFHDEIIVPQFEQKDIRQNDVYDILNTVKSTLIFLQQIFGEKHEDLNLKRDILGALFMDISMTNSVGNYSQENQQTQYGNIERGIEYIFRSLSYLIRESSDLPLVSNLSKEVHEFIDDKSTNRMEFIEKRMHQIESRALFGVVIWMIFQGFDRSMKPGQEKKDIRGLKSDEIFSTTPWVLLSIIWYLSQLKEAGMAQTPYPLPVKKLKKAVTFQFPLSGTIYLYIHDRILKDTIHLS